jgi:hypothetical protein
MITNSILIVPIYIDIAMYMALKKYTIGLPIRISKHISQSLKAEYSTIVCIASFARTLGFVVLLVSTADVIACGVALPVLLPPVLPLLLLRLGR